METIIDILDALEDAPGRLAKEAILKKHSDNELLKHVFVAAQDPYIVYYVNKFKMPKPITPERSNDDALIKLFLEQVLPRLSSREVTGNAAKELVEKSFKSMTEDEQKWCLRIILRNLRVGVQESTLKKIWPGLIKSFSVQLANQLKTHFDRVRGSIVLDEPVAFPVRVEPKLDGLRCIAIKKAGNVTLYTRSGTVLETLPRIVKAIEDASYDNFVLDGEALGADWNESASVMMSSKTQKDDSNMTLNVFDGMHLTDWEEQTNDTPLVNRIALVSELIAKFKSDAPVRQVIGITAKNTTELMEFYEKCMNEGYEGVMLKDMSAEYVFKRSDSVLKMKPVVTYEGVIVSHYEGRRGSKREGMFGGFDVVLPNGIVTRVGGGFNDAFRAEVALDPDAFIGKVIEVEGQPDPLTSDGLTKDGKVRFPVFVRVRPNDDVDQRVIIAGETYLKQKHNV